MSKIIYAVAAVLAMTSCANSFNIEGTSSLSNLDGQKLYLKVFADTAFRDVDSCDVIHGQFRFSGTVDSTQVANIFLDGTPALPVVLESGNITIKIDNMQQSVTGTPLNEELSAFATKYQQLVSASADLVHKHDQAIMDGKDMAAVTRDLQAEDAEISAKTNIPQSIRIVEETKVAQNAENEMFCGKTIACCYRKTAFNAVRATIAISVFC